MNTVYAKERAAEAALERAIRAIGTARAALLDAHELSGGAAFDAEDGAEAYAVLGEIAAWAETERKRYARTLARLAWAAGEVDAPEAEAAEAEPQREGLFGRLVRAFVAVFA